MKILTKFQDTEIIWRKAFGRKERQKDKSFHSTCEAWPDENRLWHWKKSYFLLKIGWILKNQKAKVCVKVSHIHSLCINSSWFFTRYSFPCFHSLKIWKLLRKRRWRQFFPINVFCSWKGSHAAVRPFFTHWNSLF